VVAVLGLGLVGGSLAKALTSRGFRVVGVDRPATLRRALVARAIERAEASPVRAAFAAGVVVLAAPPRTNLLLLRRLARRLPEHLVMTDVSSVKGPIVAEARRLGLSGFVGGHPLAGNEGSGFAASTKGLFDGRSWVLVPEGASPRALLVVRAIVKAAGARPAVMSAAEHDRALAFLSHVPQLVSWALLAAARGDRVARRALALAGPGFRDMTRLARSPRGLWREILAQNRPEVARAMAALRRRLRQ
jgi:prephenate dehydrogenase